jgi:hypothetical protein
MIPLLFCLCDSHDLSRRCAVLSPRYKYVERDPPKSTGSTSENKNPDFMEVGM